MNNPKLKKLNPSSLRNVAGGGGIGGTGGGSGTKIYKKLVNKKSMGLGYKVSQSESPSSTAP